jgi:hypothetical protein
MMAADVRTETFRVPTGYGSMRFLLTLLVWGLLLVFCWPLALLFLVLWPLLWLLSIPFRIVGMVIEAMFALVKAILFLPAKLLGGG